MGDGAPTLELALGSRYQASVTTPPRLIHSLQADQLPAWLSARFVQLGLDAENHAFIEAAMQNPHGPFETRLHRWLRHVAADFDINGVLNMYRLHLLSRPQWQALLADLNCHGSHLDVGAGNGDLTSALAPLFTRTQTTELSRPMARRLRRRGFACWRRDVCETGIDQQFQVVSCLNVLDRCRRPQSLLRVLAGAVARGGYLLLATPLPFAPFYFSGPKTLEPEERLEAPGPRWELALRQLVDELQHQLPSWELVKFTRAPYLSWGDSHRSLYVHDDAVLVWRSPDPGVSSIDGRSEA